ncbi:MAG: helix-turn-helix domain-containing protein [Desulfobacteraceae bacterium]|nr:MAG: helix-turn-helix domain-containing protein [Desulfobacteraceae bacterium]
MMPEENSCDVGSYLRNHRRSKAIPLEAVSQITKIRTAVLRQIESGDPKQMPPATFTKGFLRAYAEAVGADVQEAFRRYESSCTQHAREDQIQAPPRRARSVFWSRLLPAVAVFTCLIAATLYLADRMRPAEHSAPPVPSLEKKKIPLPQVEPVPTAADAVAFSNTVERNESASVLKPTGDAAGSATRHEADSADFEQDSTQTAMPGTSVQRGNLRANDAIDSAQKHGLHQKQTWILQLSAVELTWLKIVRDGGPPREITLYPDDQVTLEAQDNFDLLIGNAGGVRLRLNDEVVQIPDQSGRVVRLQLPRSR